MITARNWYRELGDRMGHRYGTTLYLLTAYWMAFGEGHNVIVHSYNGTRPTIENLLKSFEELIDRKE